MFALINNFKDRRTAEVRLSFTLLASFASIAALIVFSLTACSTKTHSTATALMLNDATEISPAAAPVWRFKNWTLKPNWVNAQIASDPRVDTRGGEVVVSIRGEERYYCPRNGVEKVRFKWEFNRDVSALRLGEDIEVALHVEPLSVDNICKGNLEAHSYTDAMTSNSAGYTDAEAPFYEDRIVWKTGDHARGGDPKTRNAVTVLTVHPNPAISKNKIRFTIKISGPCDDPQPYKCGWMDFQYNYELDATGDGGGGGGGGNANACGFSIGSGIYNKWKQTGGETGFLGCARSNEAEAGRSPLGTTGRYAFFKGWADAGVIIWHGNGTRAGRAFEVHGAIGQLYQSLGGTGSWLGFPISDEYAVAGGRRSDFEGGYIFWDAKTGRAQTFHYYDLEKGGGKSSGFTVENSINRPGGDYRSFELDEANPELCRAACANDPQCKAYTYVKPDYQGPKAKCWLKNSVLNSSANDCCITGVRKN